MQVVLESPTSRSKRANDTPRATSAVPRAAPRTGGDAQRGSGLTRGSAPTCVARSGLPSVSWGPGQLQQFVGHSVPSAPPRAASLAAVYRGDHVASPVSSTHEDKGATVSICDLIAACVSRYRGGTVDGMAAGHGGSLQQEQGIVEKSVRCLPGRIARARCVSTGGRRGRRGGGTSTVASAEGGDSRPPASSAVTR
jgi:hypothetical protein